MFTQETGLDSLLARISEYASPSANIVVRRAWEFASTAHRGQMRVSQEPFINHPIAVAGILADLGLDSATIAAGLLHDVAEDTEYGIERIRKEFGDDIADLVGGVTKLRQLDQFTEARGRLADTGVESLRKMFLAMVNDIRVVLVKLADRMHNMRTIAVLPEDKKRKIASETLEIYAPLAERLGIWQIKWELEDLSFRVLEPELYGQIARIIGTRRREREQYVSDQIETLRIKLEAEGIKAKVTGRPKHIYSIYRKAKKENIGLDKINDMIGLRVIVDTLSDCYAALGVIHTLWRPVNKPSGEPGFKDYIGMPKENMYRSLHTHVLNSDGRLVEIQIRTHEMHYTAEYGVAAHWKYKEGAKDDIVFENKIAWLRQLMEWRQDVTDAQEFVDSLKTDVFQDRVYVFSPRGEVFDLPSGSTPIDYAYQVHTEIGHRCRGAKINGRLVALDYQLQNGDQVEILTAKRGGPSRDWLNPHLGYIKTSRARQKIRQWFRRQDRAENIVQGRNVLERELKRLGIEQESYEEIAELFDFEKVDDFLAAIGYGDINSHQIVTKLLEAKREEEELELPPAIPPPTLPISEIKVKGVGNILTNLARCCNPLPGDAIVGYITRGRGVTIHRRDCPNILARLAKSERERLIEVNWGQGVLQTYPVMIKIRAWDRGGLLRDIAAVVADEDVSMSAANVTTHKKENTATIIATLEIASIAQLSRILTKIGQLPNVLEARRQVG